MVKKRMYQEIKRLQRLGFWKNKISRELGIDKKTVGKYWTMDDMEYCNYVNIKLPVSAVYDYFEENLRILPANENSLRNYIHYLEETG